LSFVISNVLIHMRHVILLMLSFLSLLGNTQNEYPADYFRPPLDIPLYLSGTFGELRTNHFHAGIDIKTQGVEGKKVYAVADGYISRIKVSLWGYGNAIYIIHPNGYVSVYGHLQKFNKRINQYVRENQYKRKSFVIELYPDKDQLKVTKGEVIALSGNTGGSMGPHLHFEIRDERNQHPVNPLLFRSIKIKDKAKPVVAELAVYPVDDTTIINDLADTMFLAVTGENGKYRLASPVKVHGSIAFGLRAYDRMDDTHNKNGIFQEQLFVDSVLVFDVQMKELSFYTSRYINSLVDYNYYQKKKRRLIRTQLDTNNQLAIYRTIQNNGIFIFNDTLLHTAQYIVKDAYGNASVFSFLIKGYLPKIKMKKHPVFPADDSVINVGFSKAAEISLNDLKVTFPAKAFYRSQLVNYGVSIGSKNAYSNVFIIGNRFIPLQKYCSASVKLNREVQDELTSKLYVAKVGKKGETSFAGGTYQDGWMSFKTRTLGNYTVLMDTIPPTIKPLNVSNGKNVSKQKSLRFLISDKPTGIKKYNGFLNGKWVLMDYNPKKGVVTYRFDWLLKKGKNEFKLYVLDNRDNETIYEAEIIN